MEQEDINDAHICVSTDKCTDYIHVSDERQQWVVSNARIRDPIQRCLERPGERGSGTLHLHKTTGADR